MMRLIKTVTILLVLAIVSCKKNNSIEQNCTYKKYDGRLQREIYNYRGKKIGK